MANTDVLSRHALAPGDAERLTVLRLEMEAAAERALELGAVNAVGFACLSNRSTDITGELVYSGGLSDLEAADLLDRHGKPSLIHQLPDDSDSVGWRRNDGFFMVITPQVDPLWAAYLVGLDLADPATAISQLPPGTAPGPKTLASYRRESVSFKPAELDGAGQFVLAELEREFGSPEVCEWCRAKNWLARHWSELRAFVDLGIYQAAPAVMRDPSTATS